MDVVASREKVWLAVALNVANGMAPTEVAEAVAMEFCIPLESVAETVAMAVTVAMATEFA